MENIYSFLGDLRFNNNRDWFNSNKSRYLDAKQSFDQMIEKLIDRLAELDEAFSLLLPKDCTYRIYRDARFSANKDPYKMHFGAFIAIGGRKSPFAGYYLHLEPGKCSLGGGIYKPMPVYLKALRSKIIKEPGKYLELINDKQFKSVFPEIYGERLKLAPKGFSKDDPNIELIKNKSYFVVYELEDIYEETAFLDQITSVYKIQKPFNDFLNEAIFEIEND
jgi:uncharacterized protein (TIGR02453 family)